MWSNFFLCLVDLLDEPRPLTRRFHSTADIEQSCRESIEKPIDFETTEVKSPPRKVLKVPQKLRDEISKNRGLLPRDKNKSPLGESASVSPELCNVSIEGRDLSTDSQEASGNAENKPSTPMKSGARKAVRHRYEKLEARPLRRSSISTTRKSDKGAHRLFVHKTKARAPPLPKETGPRVLPSADAPPKPPRAHQVENAREATEVGEAEKKSVLNKRRRASKRAMYPPSMAFPDSFLVTKAVDIPLDDEGVSPNEADKQKITVDLRECLGESTPRRLGRLPSAAGELADTKKHWSTYYSVAIASDSSQDEGRHLEVIVVGRLVSL